MKKSLGAKPLAYTTPVWIVGTYDSEGKPNVMTAAWGGICCSKPPCVCVSLRKATYSYSAILDRGAFTVSIPSETQAAQADYFGTVSGKKIDKLLATHWTPIKSDIVDAPYVEECPVILECKLIHHHEIGLHTQFVGEILDIKANEESLGKDNLPDVNKIKPFVYIPESQEYFALGSSLGKAWKIGRCFCGSAD